MNEHGYGPSVTNLILKWAKVFEMVTGNMKVGLVVEALRKGISRELYPPLGLIIWVYLCLLHQPLTPPLPQSRRRYLQPHNKPLQSPCTGPSGLGIWFLPFFSRGRLSDGETVLFTTFEAFSGPHPELCCPLFVRRHLEIRQATWESSRAGCWRPSAYRRGKIIHNARR